MIDKITEKVLLGGIIVSLGAIGFKLKQIDEKLDNQFNWHNGYYTTEEWDRKINERLKRIKEEENEQN